MPRWETGPDHVFWGPIVKCNIFQGTDATVGDGFAPLAPPLLPWENGMGRGQTCTHTDIVTTRPNRPSGPILWKIPHTGDKASLTNADGSTDTKKIRLIRDNSPEIIFLRADFTPFIHKSFQIWEPFFPLLFPKDSKNLKSLNNKLREVGAKNV